MNVLPLNPRISEICSEQSARNFWPHHHPPDFSFFFCIWMSLHMWKLPQKWSCIRNFTANSVSHGAPRIAPKFNHQYLNNQPITHSEMKGLPVCLVPHSTDNIFLSFCHTSKIWMSFTSEHRFPMYSPQLPLSRQYQLPVICIFCKIYLSSLFYFLLHEGTFASQIIRNMYVLFILRSDRHIL